ncbi:MAG TPA: neocarzinostatin apoprotein domain-containing protein [Acidimicrobiales bacterium]|jgi:hypothetical protein
MTGIFRLSWRSLLATFTALVVLVVVPTGAVDAASAKPSLSLAPATAASGQTVQVSGSGFPARSLFQVQVCGQNATHGSADCAGVASATIEADTSGNLSVPLTVVVPPTACPCVVAAFSVTTALAVTTPISIPGASTTPAPASPPTVPLSHLVVAKSELAGSTPVAAWFGFPATRTLDLTLTNTGAAPATSLHLIADLDSTPVLNTHLPPVGPGETKTYEVSVTIPALSVGNMNLNGHIFIGDGQQASFKVPVTIWPVGLLLVAIVLVQMILLAVRNIMRRRHGRNHPEPPTEPITGELPVVESPPTQQVTTV